MESEKSISWIEINKRHGFSGMYRMDTFAPVFKNSDMYTWIFTGIALAMIFFAKCIKEIIDIRMMGRMTPQERKVVLEKRNYYDNHA